VKWGKSMKVQPIITQRGTRYILLDDEYIPVTDVNKYLKYLDNIGRSPNTQRSYKRSRSQYSNCRVARI